MKAKTWYMGGIVFVNCWSTLVVLALNADALASRTTQYTYTSAGDVLETCTYNNTNNQTYSYTTAEYDSLGRQTKTVNGIGATAMTKQFTYDVAGNLVTQAVKTDGADFQTAYVYDALGRQVTVQGPSTVLDNTAPKTIYAYDAAGNVTVQSTLFTSSAAYAQTSSHYDALNRVTKIIDPEGYHRLIAYNSRSQAIRETACGLNGTPYLQQTRTTYDAAGRVVQRATMLNPASTEAPSASVDRVVDYGYDADGRTTLQRTYNMGSVTLDTVSEYDPLGRLTKTTDPQLNTENMSYDEHGFMTQRYTVENVENSVTRYFNMSYDAEGRLTTSTAVGDTSNSLVTSYGYDPAGRRIWVSDPGQRTTAYEYDLLGHQTRMIEDFSGLARTTDYIYSKQGLLVTQVAHNTAGNQSTIYDYAPIGQVASITYPDSTADRIDYLYYPNGQVSAKIDQEISGNRPTLYYHYDKRGLLTTKGRPSGDYWLTYEYDGLGRIVAARKGSSGSPASESETMSEYNGLSQLIFESQSIRGGTAKTVGMEYDQAGNRLTLVYPGN